jgi:hypothetical protein
MLPLIAATGALTEASLSFMITTAVPADLCPNIAKYHLLW